MKPKHSLLMGTACALLAFVALMGADDTVHAQTFNPSISSCMDDPTTVDPQPFTPGDPEECDGDASAGASASSTILVKIPEGDVNFAALVAFVPPEWGITPGDEIPVGAIVGQLNALATLGLINNQCDNGLRVVFTMLNASIDITDTVAFDDADDNGTGDVFEDKDDSGLQDGIEKYPEFINRITDNAQPIRRSAGIQIIAGADVLLQFLIFEPGSVIIREIASDESRGYPTVTFLQAIGDPEAEPEPGPITDFCTPLDSSNITFGVSRDNPCTDSAELEPVIRGLCEVTSAPLDLPEPGAGTTDPDESGHVLFTNPPEGNYTFSVISLGQRDADKDGFENTLDACPFDPNKGNPRIKGDADADEDGLDIACDPNDNETNSDQDGDGYLNRQDNCPLVANGEEEDNQEESDTNESGDPRPDGIGDACDPNPTVPDGDFIIAESISEVTIGPGGGNGDGPTVDDDDDGGSAVIFIIIGVIAAVVVVGGGGFLLMRRGGA